jgi:hypothetical protein
MISLTLGKAIGPGSNGTDLSRLRVNSAIFDHALFIIMAVSRHRGVEL